MNIVMEKDCSYKTKNGSIVKCLSIFFDWDKDANFATMKVVEGGHGDRTMAGDKPGSIYVGLMNGAYGVEQGVPGIRTLKQLDVVEELDPLPF